jgi:hypothetical protein
MSFHAVNPVASPHLFPRIVERPNLGARTCSDGGGLSASLREHAYSNRAAITVNFRSQDADGNLCPVSVCRYVSRFLLGHSFGGYPAPGGTASFCFGSPPQQVRSDLPGTSVFAALRVMVPP